MHKFSPGNILVTCYICRFVFISVVYFVKVVHLDSGHVEDCGSRGTKVPEEVLHVSGSPNYFPSTLWADARLQEQPAAATDVVSVAALKDLGGGRHLV